MPLEVTSNIQTVALAPEPPASGNSSLTERLAASRKVQTAREEKQQATEEINRARIEEQKASQRLREAQSSKQRANREVQEASAERREITSDTRRPPRGQIVNVIA